MDKKQIDEIKEYYGLNKLNIWFKNLLNNMELPKNQDNRYLFDIEFNINNESYSFFIIRLSDKMKFIIRNNIQINELQYSIMFSQNILRHLVKHILKLE